MITFLHTPRHPVHGAVRVLLDVTVAELNAPGDALRQFAEEAAQMARQVGVVLREWGGDSYFSYVSADQAPLQAALLSLFLTPVTMVEVTQAARREYEAY